MEVQEGGKISITLGLLINIYYIVQMSIFIFTFLPSVKFQNVNFLKIYIEKITYFLAVRFSTVEMRAKTVQQLNI